jgi:hypothetical protein
MLTTPRFPFVPIAPSRVHRTPARQLPQAVYTKSKDNSIVGSLLGAGVYRFIGGARG